jgi:hypothetical protein
MRCNPPSDCLVAILRQEPLAAEFVELCDGRKTALGSVKLERARLKILELFIVRRTASTTRSVALDVDH